MSKVPIEIRDAILSHYLKKCDVLQAIALFQWRLETEKFFEFLTRLEM